MSVVFYGNDVMIDTNHLIRLIEERPSLWDRTLEEYKFKTYTTAAWKEVLNLLHPNYESLPLKDQVIFHKSVMKRWKGLRSTYVKIARKPPDKEEGQNKKYIFEDQLKFLNKIYNHIKIENIYSATIIEDEIAANANQENNGDKEDIQSPKKNVTDISLDENGATEEVGRNNKELIHSPKRNETVMSRNENGPKEEVANSNEYSSDEDSLLNSKAGESSEPILTIRRGVKRKKIGLKEELLKAIEKHSNPHMSFMNCLLPTLNNLTPSQTLDFQYEVVKVLKRITSKDAVEATDPLLC